VGEADSEVGGHRQTLRGDGMIVEFIGGPLDGETAELPDNVRYWRIPISDVHIMEPWEETDVDQYLASIRHALRCGVYSPKGDRPRDFIWRGEEER